MQIVQGKQAEEEEQKQLENNQKEQQKNGDEDDQIQIPKNMEKYLKDLIQQQLKEFYQLKEQLLKQLIGDQQKEIKQDEKEVEVEEDKQEQEQQKEQQQLQQLEQQKQQQQKQLQQQQQKQQQQQQYQQEQEQQQQKNQLKSIQFTDEEFPPLIKSISSDVEAYQLICLEKFKTNFVFKRVKDVLKDKEINLFSNKLSFVKDVKQGALGDCYCIAVIVAISQHPHIIKQIFKTDQYNEEGKYVLNMIKNGLYTEVVVDDYLPCYPDSRGFAFASSPHNTCIWPSLVEKAIAKMYNSYTNIEGTKRQDIIGPGTSEIFMHLTGCPSQQFHMKLGEPDSLKDIEDAWTKLYEGQKKGYLFTAGISTSSVEGEKALSNGLISNHAYCILEVKQIKDLRLIKLKNTWAETEWNLDWSDESSKWTEEIKKETNLEVENDGIFWMSFEDFYANYSIINIAQFNPEYKFSSMLIKNQKQLAIYTYQLSLVDNINDITGSIGVQQNLEFSQQDKYKTICSSLCVFEMNEDNSKPISLIANSREVGKEIFSDVILKKGKNYTIQIIVDFAQQQPQDIVLSFYANQKINFTEQNLLNSNNIQLLVDYIDTIDQSEYKTVLEQNIFKGLFDKQIILGSILVYTIRNDTKNKTFTFNTQFTNENVELLKDIQNYNSISQIEESEPNKIKITIPSQQNAKLFFRQKEYLNYVVELGHSKNISLELECYPNDEEINELLIDCEKDNLIENEIIDGEIYSQYTYFDRGIIFKFVNTTNNKKFVQKYKFISTGLTLLNPDIFEKDENDYFSIILLPQTSYIIKFENTDVNVSGKMQFAQGQYQLTDIQV